MESHPISIMNQNQGQGLSVNQTRANLTLMSQNSSMNNSSVNPQAFSVDYASNSTFKSIDGAEIPQNGNY